MGEKLKEPQERYAQDVHGFPVFAAESWFAVLLMPEAMANAIPADPEHCAIANGCRSQLQTPYVHVGRYRTDLALPHSKGVRKPGWGHHKWAIYRFKNPQAARRVIIAADTQTLDGRGVVVELAPPKASDRPGRKRDKNKRFRQPKGVNDGRGVVGGNGQDELTLLGVRDLRGQRRNGN